MVVTVSRTAVTTGTWICAQLRHRVSTMTKRAAVDSDSQAEIGKTAVKAILIWD